MIFAMNPYIIMPYNLNPYYFCSIQLWLSVLVEVIVLWSVEQAFQILQISFFVVVFFLATSLSFPFTNISVVQFQSLRDQSLPLSFILL